MLFVSVFVSMLEMMILIISVCVRPHCFQNIAKSCLDSGYRPTVDVYLLKFELPIPGLWRAPRTFTDPPEHPYPLHPPLNSPLTYKLAGREGVKAGWGRVI